MSDDYIADLEARRDGKGGRGGGFRGIPRARFTPDDHEQRMLVARAYAQWVLGDAMWADKLLESYMNPGTSARVLLDEVYEAEQESDASG